MRIAAIISFWANTIFMGYSLVQFGISENIYYAIWAAFAGTGAILGAIAIPWLD